MFHESPFLDPSDRLPPLKLDSDFPGVDRLYQVEIDMPFDGIACEVEWLVELDKG